MGIRHFYEPCFVKNFSQQTKNKEIICFWPPIYMQNCVIMKKS